MIFLLLFSSLAFAESVRIPSYALGVVSDPSQKGKTEFTYEVKGELRERAVVPQATANGTIDELTASVVRAHHENKPDDFLKLFSPAALKEARSKMDEATFRQLWSQFKKAKSYVRDWYFEHQGGTIVSWRQGDQKNSTLFFAKKKGDRWFIENFVNDESDARFHNLMTYLRWKIFEVKKATLLKGASASPAPLEILAQVRSPIVSVLAREGNDWVVVYWLFDNQESADLEKARGLVKVMVERESLPPVAKPEVLVIESTFPLTHLPVKVIGSGNL